MVEKVAQEWLLVVANEDYFDNCKLERMALANFHVICEQLDKDMNIVICTDLTEVNDENEPFTWTSPSRLLLERSLYSDMAVVSIYTWKYVILV